MHFTWSDNLLQSSRVSRLPINTVSFRHPIPGGRKEHYPDAQPGQTAQEKTAGAVCWQKQPRLQMFSAEGAARNKNYSALP